MNTDWLELDADLVGGQPQYDAFCAQVNACLKAVPGYHFFLHSDHLRAKAKVGVFGIEGLRTLAEAFPPGYPVHDRVTMHTDGIHDLCELMVVCPDGRAFSRALPRPALVQGRPIPVYYEAGQTSRMLN